MLSDQVVNESSLVITPTSEADAGIYMVKIASFGLPNDTNETCAAIILKHLTSYAIFQGVEFYAYNRLSKIWNSILNVIIYNIHEKLQVMHHTPQI